jgi:hypothetical protein
MIDPTCLISGVHLQKQPLGMKNCLSGGVHLKSFVSLGTHWDIPWDVST